ncbi:MAG TPA: nucleotidyltransferase [Bacteroidia bacterium]|jgi:hypothetical protein|nr:nucleotidyltransferase [Bacteroidia bacterium]
MATDKSKHLDEVLQSHRMAHVEPLMNKYIKKRDEVKEGLDKKYSQKKVSSPINSGSYAKHDAINTKFDIDLCIPFQYDAFTTLEEMADDVFNFFSKEYKDLQLVQYEIRKQRVSIGLTFLIDGDIIKMDIVPGRELSKGDYEKTKNLNLYVRAKLDKPATTTQTNIQAHIDHIKEKNDERQIIRLLKIWKTHHNSDIKSFFVELIIIRAFEDNAGKVPSELWEKLNLALEFIRDKVTSISLKDPANSNNIVSNILSDSEKINLSLEMKRMLERIYDNEDNIKIYFPVNDKYVVKQKGNGHSKLKTESFG